MSTPQNVKTRAYDKSLAYDKTLAYDKNPELIERYRNGDSAAGERLVMLNRPLVASVASRFSDRGVEKDELMELGNIGLVKAINSFDLSRGCAFSTYAVPLIFGEIRRFLRDDGPIKVSREEKRLSALVLAERERRLASGEDPRISELASALGISVSDATSALYAQSPVRSLDDAAYSDDDSVSLGSVLFDEDAEERELDKLALKTAIESLPELHRKIVVLRYFRDYSQQRTADALGLSQVKVSREEKKLLAALREKLDF